MTQNTKQFSNFLVTLVITVLLLTGAVPSFAWAKTSSDHSESTVQSSVQIDKKHAPKIFGTSGIAMDMKTGTVLYEKKADEVRQPASVTKILTCLVVLENMPLDQVVTVPEGIEMGGSVMGVEPGE
ncbi:MAG: hypothetical protein IJ100_04840, partial [Lachnospiraceae bacterium]|nr:hypothetical protein [Lachnospiraceae bacterium]